jgi:CRP-like cAMP-binding protein
MSEMDGELKIIRNKVSRQDLAKVVGASREMVSRVMKDLEGRGMVQTQENGWVVIKELTATEFRRRSDSRPWIASRIAGARVLRRRAAAVRSTTIPA